MNERESIRSQRLRYFRRASGETILGAFLGIGIALSVYVLADHHASFQQLIWIIRAEALLTGAIYAVAIGSRTMPLGLWLVALGLYQVLAQGRNWGSTVVIFHVVVVVVLAHVAWLIAATLRAKYWR
jgi:hypothetical protein